MSNCEKNGGRCRIEFTYQNQCVAAVTSELASTGTQYASSGRWRAPGSRPCVTVRQQAGRIAGLFTRNVPRRSSASIESVSRRRSNAWWL
ncbi:hypothetical protein [Stenotrophomonas sepilia]|uniref:hypothetical protein n=1 Tax=Stenotrophomonas sepilia TaxID=2860290 RepID=UPI0039080834